MNLPDGALAGLKVLDLTHALAGPYCTMLLADLGADIVKVEHPNGGDRTRIQGRVGDFSSYFGSVNRGKRSILLDMKNPAGKDIAKRLSEKADVVVVNFSPGVVERLGLDYATLSANNPRLIYAICSGYGQNGPWKDKTSTDPIIQAVSGAMSLTGEPDGPPVRVGYSMGDMGGGIFLTIGILSALYERQCSGKGQMLDLSLLDCHIALLENPIVNYLFHGKVAKRTGSRHPRALLTRIYPTKDGMVMAGFSKRNWEKVVVLLGHPEWKDDPRFDSPDSLKEIEPLLDNVMKTQATEYWLEKIQAAGISCVRVNSIPEAIEEPQVKAREMIQETVDSKGRRLKVVGSPIKLSRTPGRVRGAAPLLGEHTDTVMRDWLGMNDEERSELAEQGAFREGRGNDQWIW